MSPDVYREHYRTLEIEAGCTWPQLKTAYRLAAKAWHPDHFAEDSEQRRHAEEKIKHINRAFRALADYHRKHGALPDEKGDAVEARGARSSGASAASHKPESRQQPDADHAVDATPKRSRRASDVDATYAMPRPVAVLVVVMLVYGLWHASSPSSVDAPHSEPGTATPGERPLTDDTTNIVAPDGLPDNPYFTVGSTLGEVHAIQGNPTHAADGVWHYGESRVYFHNGIVSYWDSQPSHPLRAEAAGHPRDNAVTGFKLGSTKAQVMAVQGRPLVEAADEWNYGISRVKFENDRVVGWYNSPLNPLRVQQTE